jgi:hypothetical protein
MQGFPFVGGVPFRVGDQVSKGMHGCLLLCCVWIVLFVRLIMLLVVVVVL